VPPIATRVWGIVPLPAKKIVPPPNSQKHFTTLFPRDLSPNVSGWQFSAYQFHNSLIFRSQRPSLPCYHSNTQIFERTFWPLILECPIPPRPTPHQILSAKTTNIADSPLGLAIFSPSRILSATRLVFIAEANILILFRTPCSFFLIAGSRLIIPPTPQAFCPPAAPSLTFFPPL